MTGYLSVTDARKSYGKFVALDGVSLEAEAGEFICFLGPSGCGKTTLLRSIAGLETIDQGRITQGGADITRLPPSARDFGILFQSYALFPNLTVFDNIAYGLVAQRKPRSAIASRVAELVALTGLAGQEQKYPTQLSGGQQQRVALARALAPMPGLLLLDEPLSALDAKVRAHLRREIKTVHRQVGLTTIMVTHDREEALTMADRIAVMRAGRIEQMATPQEIYDAPATPFVADFISGMNLIQAERLDANRLQCGNIEIAVERQTTVADQNPICGFKLEDVQLVSESAAGPNLFPGRVADVENLGAMLRVYVATDLSDREIRLDLPHNHGTAAPRQNDKVNVFVPSNKILVFRGEA